MGHFAFIILHLVAALFFFAGLLLTIPLHIIYAVMASRAAGQQQQAAQAQRERAQLVRCPECREEVRWDARKCKHCGATLTPQMAPPRRESERDYGRDVAIGVVMLVVAVVMAKACS